jgi:hypothetical protein
MNSEPILCAGSVAGIRANAIEIFVPFGAS